MELFLEWSCLNTEATLFGKRALAGNQKRQVEIKYSPNRKLFLTPLIQIKKKFFFQKGQFLTKRPIPGRFIFPK